MSEVAQAAPEPDSPVPGVKRPVFVLGIVSFLTDVSSEMVYPLVPLFLTSTLGGPLGAGGLVDGTGKGIRPAPREALVAEVTPPELRGRAFGFHRAADTLGAVTGPVAALGLLAAFDDSFRLVFIVAFAPAA